MADQKIAPGTKPTPAPAPANAKKEDTKTRAERFKELAPKRTRSILKALEVLGNCSNKSGYEYTDADVSKIFGAIEKKVADTRSKFAAKAAEKDISFSL